tara:strand:- start:204 stop:842 length:639 start_codon:yes stop_codon:yes gene_type:complete
MRGLFFVLWMLGGCGLLESDDAVKYTVVRGDTLTRIAQAHGVSVDQLQAWNGLDGDRIDVGQVLTIRSGAPPTAATAPVTKRTRPSPSAAGSRRLPALKPCLKGPSLSDLDEDVPDVLSSAGLSMAQVRAPMREALAGLGDCLSGAWPDTVVDLSITVACSGRVSGVQVLDGGGLDAGTLACFQDGLRYVGFPAHDMPDGFQFRYPVTLSPQ